MRVKDKRLAAAKKHDFEGKLCDSTQIQCSVCEEGLGEVSP